MNENDDVENGDDGEKERKRNLIQFYSNYHKKITPECSEQARTKTPS